MRKALLTLLVCALAACTGQPLTTVGINSAAKEALAERVFPQTSAFDLSETPNLSEVLHAFAGGPDISGRIRANQWENYLEPLAKFHPELQKFPPLIEVLAVETLEEAQNCNQRPTGLRPPFICRENDPFPNKTDQEYLIVTHVRLPQEVSSVTAKSGTSAGWLAATVAMSVMYSQYLQQLYGAFTGWPVGRTVDYCVAGVSSRAVYPEGALTERAVAEAMAATDGLLEVPSSTRSARVEGFLQGFSGGKLVDCLK